MMLLNDRTPVEQFDVTGPFDALEPTLGREEFRQRRPGSTSGFEGRHAEHRTGKGHRSPARRRQRLDRSDLRAEVVTQSFIPAVNRRQCQHPSAHLRPQSG